MGEGIGTAGGNQTFNGHRHFLSWLNIRSGLGRSG